MFNNTKEMILILFLLLSVICQVVNESMPYVLAVYYPPPPPPNQYFEFCIWKTNKQFKRKVFIPGPQGSSKLLNSQTTW